MRFTAVHLAALLSFGIVLAPVLDSTPASARSKRKKKRTSKATKPVTKTAKTSGNRVAILKFDTFKTSTEVMDVFYRSLNQQLKAKQGNKIVPAAKVSLNELVLTAGCAEPNKACLNSLSTFIKADQLVFGSVQQSDNVHLFTIKIFDFNKKAFVRVIEDQTIEGKMDKLKQAIPAVVESAIYGNVGKITVKISGAQNPTIYFDGDVRAKGSTTLEELPLGEHVIKVKTSNGGEQTKTIILRQGKVPVLSFVFDELVKPPAVSDSGSSPLIVPGWVTLGVGVVALGFGGYNYLQLGTLEDEANTAFDGKPLPSTDSEASSRRADVDQRQADMDTAYTRANIGLTVGIAGVALGTGMLIYGYMSGSDNDATAGTTTKDNGIQVGFAPTRGGAAMSFGATF